MEAERKAAHLAVLNVLAVARQHLGSLDKVTRIVRLGVSVATSGGGPLPWRGSKPSMPLVSRGPGRDKVTFMTWWNSSVPSQDAEGQMTFFEMEAR